MAEIIANSGSAVDIQSAVNDIKQLNENSIVHIPEGDFETNGTIKSPAGVSIIGAGKNKTILRRIVPVFNSEHYGSVGDGFSRLSGMSVINGNPVSEEVRSGTFEFRGCPTFRMDNCYIRGRFSTMMNATRNSLGLLDHCEFDVYTSYGIYIWGKNVWEEDINKILGMGEDTTFIEDCSFKGFYDHPVDARQGTHYVLRHCNFYLEPKSGPIEGHGPISNGTHGTRCMEIYNNTIEVNGYSPSAGILYRSGGGVVFDNTIKNKRWGIAVGIESGYTHTYPVYEQVKDLWIWNNSYGVVDDNITTVWDSQDMIQENRDYFMREKSGYTPYAYPHPLVQSKSEPEPESQPEPEYVKKTVLIEALQDMIGKIKE